MKKIVAISGASGFLGRYVCKAMADGGHRIIGVGRAREPADDMKRILSEWIPWDMTSAGAPVLPTGINAIVHLAQSSLYRQFPVGARDMFDVNLRSTFELLEFARERGVSQFVYASSGGVYGDSRPESAEEPVLARHQLGFYLVSKLTSELLVKTYENVFATAILRFFFPYGPGQQADRLIPRLIQNVADGQPLKLQGDEGLTINPVFVTDAAAVVASAVDQKLAATIDVAGAEAISLRRLGAVIGDSIGRQPSYEVSQNIPASTLLGNSKEMIVRVGYTPKIGLSDGIASVVADWRLLGHKLSGPVT